MNHHWRQQSPCILPARLHKPLDQGSSCSYVHTHSCFSHSSLCILSPNSHTSPARTNLFPSPCMHTRQHTIHHTPAPSNTQADNRNTETHSSCPTTLHISALNTLHKHTSLPSRDLEHKHSLKFLSRLNRWAVISKGRYGDLFTSWKIPFLRGEPERDVGLFLHKAKTHTCVSGRVSEGRAGN